MHRALPVLAILAVTACSGARKPEEPVTPPAAEQPTPHPAPEPQATVVRDPELEQRLARSELRLLEKEAQIEDLQTQLSDARQEVVRAMAKLQSLATRAEAASGIAEAEIALESLRSAGALVSAELGELMKQSTAEFDKQNYGGALYLANQAKSAATTRGQLASADRGTLRPGEVPFALPLELQTASRANVREGPGGNFKVLFTLPAGAAITGQSYAEQWVRITDDSGRRGWVYRNLIGRRP
jgi:uncharacterized coiled-coil protein SlyX